LPTSPGPGIEFAWVDPSTGQGTQPECEGARQYPFIAGYAPQAQEHCFFQQLKNFFGVGVGSDGNASQPLPQNAPQAQH